MCLESDYNERLIPKLESRKNLLESSTSARKIGNYESDYTFENFKLIDDNISKLNDDRKCSLGNLQPSDR